MKTVQFWFTMISNITLSSEESPKYSNNSKKEFN